MRQSWRMVLTGSVLLLIAAESTAQENRIFPLRGAVACPGKPGLYVRKAPPKITGFSYQLSDPICGVGNGSEFVALEELYLANGEIWFRAHFTKITGSLGNCPRDLSGWMVGKLKDRWAVSILEQNVTLQSPEPAAPVTAQSSSAEQEEGNSFKPLVDYLLLLLGTAIAVCIVSIERAKNVRPKHWASSFMAFEWLALSGVNLLVAVLLIDQLSQVPEPNLLFHLFRVVQGAQGGFALLGFLLSVVLMKFISFAKTP